MKFYSHLVDIESVIVELDALELSPKEKAHLAQLVDSNLHHMILDTILSELSEEDKKSLVNSLREEDQEKIWELLHSRVDQVEDKIKAVVEEVKKEMHEDLKEAKRIKIKEAS